MIKLILAALICSAECSSSMNVTHNRFVRGVEVNTILEGTKGGAELVKSLCEAIKENGPKLSKLVEAAGKIASLLGPVGAAFSLVTVFMPKGKSDELQAIEAGFKQVELRFDNLEMKLNELSTTVNKNFAYEHYDNVQSNLNNVYLKYKRFIKRPRDQIAKDEFTRACNDGDTDPDICLNNLHSSIVSPGLGPKLMQVMLEDSEYDMKTLKRFFAVIMKDAGRAAYLRQACLGTLYPKDKNAPKRSGKESQSKIKDMVRVFQQTMDQLVRDAINKRLDIDMKKKLNDWRNVNNADYSRKLKDFLDNKYSWLLWSVHAYNPVFNYDMVHHPSKNTWYSWVEYGRNLVVSRSDRIGYQSKRSWLSNMRGTLEGVNRECHYLTNVNSFTSRVDSIASQADSYLVVRRSANMFSKISDNTLEFYMCDYYVALKVA